MSTGANSNSASADDPGRSRDRVDEDHSHRLRVALYSHDAMGVGHVRRNLLIAQHLNGAPHYATTLMICGVHEATAFCRGSGVDCLTIPSLEKVANNDYQPRDLQLSRADVVSIRAATLRGSLQALRPDLVLVDKVPKGLEDELVEILPSLRAAGSRIVFGMREVLDEPGQVRREWAERGYEKFLRENYDAIWVYGDPNIFDPIIEYGLESLRDLTTATGYFDQRDRLKLVQHEGHSESQLAVADSDTILCMVGGGQDGVALAEAFSGAVFPAGKRGLLVTGPLMGTKKVAQLELVASTRPNLAVIRCVAEADLLVERAERVVCMGGYNSMMSVVSFEKPALVVPRVAPRMEQSIRADLFRQHNLVDVLPPDQLSSFAISDWLAAPPVHARPDRRCIDLGAGTKIRQLVSRMFATSSPNPQVGQSVGKPTARESHRIQRTPS